MSQYFVQKCPVWRSPKIAETFSLKNKKKDKLEKTNFYFFFANENSPFCHFFRERKKFNFLRKFAIYFNLFFRHSTAAKTTWRCTWQQYNPFASCFLTKKIWILLSVFFLSVINLVICIFNWLSVSCKMDWITEEKTNMSDNKGIWWYNLMFFGSTRLGIWFELNWTFILTYHLHEHVLGIYTKILKVSEYSYDKFAKLHIITNNKNYT